MRLVLASAVREHDTDMVARESPWGLSVLWAVFLALGVVGTGAPLAGGGAAWIGPLLGLPCLLVVAWTARSVAPAWRRDWWIVRVRRDGLALRLRSQLNRDLPDEWAHVVLLERHDVRRIVAERIDLRGLPHESSRGATRLRLTFELAESVPAEIARSLAREIEPGMRRRTHFRVALVSRERVDALSVTWSGPSIRMTPRLAAMLRELERLGYPVERGLRPTTLEWDRLDRAERERRIDELARAGEQVRAMELWRLEHGGSLADAKSAIEARRTRSAA
jgi:hypothetical protein